MCERAGVVSDGVLWVAWILISCVNRMEGAVFTAGAGIEGFGSVFGPHPAWARCACQSGSRIMFAASGPAFQTYDVFERRACLAHTPNAHCLFGTTVLLRP